MKRFVHNIVLRTITYYVVLFGVAATLYRLPRAQIMIRASLDAFGFGRWLCRVSSRHLGQEHATGAD